MNKITLKDPDPNVFLKAGSGTGQKISGPASLNFAANSWW